MNWKDYFFIVALFCISICVLALVMLTTNNALAAEQSLSFSWEYDQANETKIDGYRIMVVADPDIPAVDNISPSAREISATLDDGGIPDCRKMYIVAFKGGNKSAKSNVVTVCPGIPAVINFSGVVQ